MDWDQSIHIYQKRNKASLSPSSLSNLTYY